MRTNKNTYENATRGKMSQYTDTQTGKTFCQINKRKAEKMFNLGYNVYMHPHKMRVNNIWQNPTPTNRAGGEFSKTLNAFIYYNCNTETGRYPNYFVLLDDLIGFNLCNAIAAGNNKLTTK